MKLSIKHLLIFFSLSLISTYQLKAQAQIEWERSFGGSESDAAVSIVATSDGGYLTAGFSSSDDGDVENNYGNRDILVVKFGDSGNIEWQKNYGGSGSDGVWSIISTLDGGYALAGSSNSSDGDLSGNYGERDFWLLKIEENGTIEFGQNYGGSNDDYATSINATPDGGYLLGGFTQSSDNDVSENYGMKDYWVIKVDSIGNVEWEQNYGGSNDDSVEFMLATEDQGTLILGYSQSNDGDIGQNKGGKDYWLIKVDTIGNIEWEQNYGGSNDETPTSIHSIGTNGYLITGYSESNDFDVSENYGFNDAWIIKIDNDGAIEWEKNYGGNNQDHINTALISQDGTYTLIGFSASSDGDITNTNGGFDSWILKIDNTGNVIWNKKFGGSDYDTAYGIHPAINNGYIIVGESFSFDGDLSDNKGFNDFWIKKIIDLPTSLKKTEAIPPIRIAPNPCDGMFTISTGDHIDFRLEVVDILGRTIQEDFIHHKLTQIKELQTGSYWIKMTGREWIITKVLIVH